MEDLKSRGVLGSRVRCRVCGESGVARSLGELLVAGNRVQVVAAGELLTFLGAKAPALACGGCGNVSAL